MAREITSKHIDGITDLVVFAPIREGFIDAYENVPFETRARIVAEALHILRVSAREYEKNIPFSDIAERILTLLDYRIAIFDKDLFQLHSKRGLTARRYIVLSVTFDGPWEPYMRLVWRPLGVFLDLIFCNCEDYRPACDSSFEDYARWVRSVQVDSAIFYSTTGLTLRDQIYLRELERVQRDSDPDSVDHRIAQLTMPDPELQAAADLIAGRNHALELGLEALTVLYRLSDYFPPDRLDPNSPAIGADLDPVDPDAPKSYTCAEGRYLLRAARSLLQDFDFDAQARLIENFGTAWQKIRLAYREQLAWFNDTTHLGSLEEKRDDPPADDKQVQAGILNPIGTDARPVRHGALLLMTVTNAVDAREFLKKLTISCEGDPEPADGLYCTIAFTVQGLRRIGYPEWRRRHFPKEFREGMERRAGLLGDYRENYPRSWKPPVRNWPEREPGGPPEPPVEMAEVDFVIQLRHAPEKEEEGDSLLRRKIAQIASDAANSGAVLAAWEPMVSYRTPAGDVNRSEEAFGHFKLRDGLSQPHLGTGRTGASGYEQGVSRGELLNGYGNDRGDCAPPQEGRSGAWAARKLMFNGSFLVIRKLEQNVKLFEDYLADESRRIAEQYKIDFTPDQLKACLVGRNSQGTPLIAPASEDPNDFHYDDDPRGEKCPLGAHIRRANPRKPFLGRPTPRLMRRGMSFGPQDAGVAEPKGVIFMAYCASIAEQFETIQRWLNAGNSTGQNAAQNDPLLGVRPARGRQVYRFIHEGKVIRTSLPTAPYVDLHWGMYLFVPARAAFESICAGFEAPPPDIDEPGEQRGRALIEQIDQLPPKVQITEWRRILEDFDTKDPAERDRSPDIWSAIRHYKSGSYRIGNAQRFAWEVTYSGDKEHLPGVALPPIASDTEDDAPSVVLVGSKSHVREVLSKPGIFSVEVQAKRMGRTSGDIYVAMQPGQKYSEEATATNAIMFEQDEKWGFEAAYRLATEALNERVALAREAGRRFKIELRRDFIAPTLGKLCTEWFGVPFDPSDPAIAAALQAPPAPGDRRMIQGGWSWRPMPRHSRCPGDFLAPSRNAFYPLPNGPTRAYARMHGPAILESGHAFVAAHPPGTAMKGNLASKMAEAIREADISHGPKEREDLLARNIIGMMIGMLPPLDGNLRSILYEWLTERTLWRHQGALLRALGGAEMSYDKAKVLLGPVTRAMCKRPSPDLLHRRATADYVLKGSDDRENNDVSVKKGDIVIVSLVSAAQWSLIEPSADKPDGDLSFVFGGERKGVDNGTRPLHACPAQKMMTGAIIGILAALLNIGRIKALPSSLIVELSDWR